MKLACADPTARTIVDMQFLSHPDSMTDLECAMKMTREIAHSPALKEFVVRDGQSEGPHNLLID